MKRLALILAVLFASTAFGEEPEKSPVAELPEQLAGWPNLVMKTWGGTQFWSDELVFRDWRVQRNVYSDHYRLLDADDYRRAWGSPADCLSAFEKLKEEK